MLLMFGKEEEEALAVLGISSNISFNSHIKLLLDDMRNEMFMSRLDGSNLPQYSGFNQEREYDAHHRFIESDL